MMNPQIQLSHLRQIALVVSDVDKALAFYRDLLGLRFLFRPAPHLAFLDAGGIRIMLSVPEGAGSIGNNSILYFHVQGIEEVHEELVRRGAIAVRKPEKVAEMPDHHLWISFIQDPDENLIGLMDEKIILKETNPQ